MIESPESTETAENSVVDDSLIMTLMRAFYARVRVDPLIGPIFNARIEDRDNRCDYICLCPSRRSISIAGSSCLRLPRAKCAPQPLRNSSFSAPAPSVAAWRWV